MGISYTRQDLAYIATGETYSISHLGELASYAAGWTFTGIDMSGHLQTEAVNSATDTTSWGNAAFHRPIVVAISSGASGFTPVSPDDADLDNAQWEYIASVPQPGLSFIAIPGSDQVGSSFLIPFNIHYRTQKRLAVATDYYVAFYCQDSASPTFGLTGIATLWVS